jgi:molybdopterin molybdotransferase
MKAGSQPPEAAEAGSRKPEAESGRRKPEAEAMRPIRETLPMDEAMALVLEAARPLTRTERVSLRDATGRVLASPAVSAIDVPPFDRAAMDGYAVIAEDTFGAGRYEPKVLRCVEKVYTGQVPTQTLAHGECIEIATGAPMPAGATAVVMVEETEKGDSGDVRIFTPVYPRQHVGRRAADIAAGQALLSAGATLSASRIGALAAIGATEIDVFAKPRVAILSTGNEIVEPGGTLQPGQIYDINQFTITSVVATHGGIAVRHPPAPDNLPDLVDAIREAAGADIVVFSGGSSVGERDLILDAMQQIGEVVFHGIAVKPGKPTVFGRVGDTPVFGMPGYPTSCLSNAYMLLVPMLRRMARLPEYMPQIVKAPLARRIVSTTGRHQFYTVRLVDGAALPAFKASGDITSMSLADGYIEIPAQTDILEAGEVVDVKLF